MCEGSNSLYGVSQGGERCSDGCRAQDLGNPVLVVKRKALMFGNTLQQLETFCSLVTFAGLYD